MTAADVHYEIADRARGITSGGIEAIHILARHVGLIEVMDRRLHLLKFRFPFHESDHVLTFAQRKAEEAPKGEPQAAGRYRMAATSSQAGATSVSVCDTVTGHCWIHFAGAEGK